MKRTSVHKWCSQVQKGMGMKIWGVRDRRFWWRTCEMSRTRSIVITDWLRMNLMRCFRSSSDLWYAKQSQKHSDSINCAQTESACCVTTPDLAWPGSRSNSSLPWTGWFWTTLRIPPTRRQKITIGSLLWRYTCVETNFRNTRSSTSARRRRCQGFTRRASTN